jgi:DNA replication licensing factor MCM4
VLFILSDIDQLITVGGMVIRVSSLIPEMREAFFKCYVCGNTTSVEIDRGRIAEPVLCTNCNTNHSFAMIHNRSQFTDKQMIKLQESPGELENCCVLETCVNMLNMNSKFSVLLAEL